MCYLITLVVDGADEARIDAFMRDRGRRAQRSNNPAIAAALHRSEQQYSTSVMQCDCGTALAPKSAADPDYAPQAAKLRRQGWSEAKIERALAQKRKAAHRPPRGLDSVEYWASVLRDLPAAASASGAGVLLHWYSGSFEDEEFAVTSAEASVATIDASLAALSEDVLLRVRG